MPSLYDNPEDEADGEEKEDPSAPPTAQIMAAIDGQIRAAQVGGVTSGRSR